VLQTAPRSPKPPSPAQIDAIFRALADPTRRKIIERLGAGASSVSTLAADHRMALPSFVEHIKVLEGAGLVRTKKTGRVRTCELAPEKLAVAQGWLDRQRAIWEARLDRLDTYLLALKKERGL
jgi:DNA-binding transcriptional ArsR family regulator